MTDYILIVEDSATRTQLLRILLETHGYAVKVAGNGQEGLAAAREIKPSLIISDIAMPVMDGYQMCRAVKDDPSIADIPVMLLTSLADPRDILRGLQAGTDYYLTKPYEDEHMLDRVESALAMEAQLPGEDTTGELILKTVAQPHADTLNRKQILTLLLSTYENALQNNRSLVETQLQLEELNDELEDRVQYRTRQLQDSEQLYRALFEQAADSVVLIDPESGTVVEFNERAHKDLGYTREEFAKLRITDLAVSESPEESINRMETILEEGHLIFEVEHKAKNGEARSRLVSARVLSLKGKDFVQAIATDLTDRKRTESELAATTGQLEEALDWARENAEIANALSEAASVLNSSLNIDDVLHRILEAVGRVVPHDAADIMLLNEADGGGLEAQIVRGRGYEGRQQGQSPVELRLRVTDVPNLQKLVDTDQPVAISDTQASDDWVRLSETAWIRSWAGAPLRVGGERIGILNVSSERAGFFTQESADRLQTFADHAAIAIQNARLFSQAEKEIIERIAAEAEIRKRSEDLTLLNSISDSINRQDSLPKIINIIADQTAEVFSGYGITVSLLSDDKTQLHLQNLPLPPLIVGQIAKLTDRAPSDMSFSIDGSKIHRKVIHEGKSILVDDAAELVAHIEEVATVVRLPSERGRKAFVKLIPKLFRSLNIESMMFAPLVSEDEPIGLVQLASKGRLSPEDLSRFEAIAAQLTIAIKRKQAEEALRESEGKFRTLSEKSPSMIFINQGGKVVYANEACVTYMGYTLEEFYADDFDFLILISLESRKLAQENFRQHMGGAEVPPVEYRLVTKEGRFLEAILTTRLIQFGGEPAILGILTDVTQRRRAEEEIRKLNQELDQRVRDRTHELEAANKELDSFSYSVSHDLRAPLRAMDGFSRILMEDYGSELSVEGQGYLKRVRDNAKQMGQLVDDLLAFSRLGRAEMRKQLLDLGDLVHQVLAELTGEGENGHAEVSIAELPECYGDPTLLKQVYVNLLSNALKFSSKREDAKIEVGYEDVNGEVTYYVKDNGAGFDMAYADKLFGVFQRLHGPEDFEGTGVGLAIVQRVVQRHGGRIWTEAEVDQGATFFFTLDGEKRDG